MKAVKCIVWPLVFTSFIQMQQTYRIRHKTFLPQKLFIPNTWLLAVDIKWMSCSSFGSDEFVNQLIEFMSKQILRRPTPTLYDDKFAAPTCIFAHSKCNIMSSNFSHSMWLDTYPTIGFKTANIAKDCFTLSFSKKWAHEIPSLMLFLHVSLSSTLSHFIHFQFSRLILC